MKEIKLLDPQQLVRIAEEILQQAKAFNVEQAEVNIEANKGFTVSARDGDVETIEYNQDKAIEITVFYGKRMGTASLSDMTTPAIKAAVEAACHIAQFTDEDPAAGLADPSDLAYSYPALQTAYPWDISVEKAIEMACQCEQEALAFDKRIMIAEDTQVGTIEAINLYANSLGFMGYYPLTHHEISCVLVAKEGDEMQRDYSYSIVTNPARLRPVTEIAHEAAQRVVRRLGARSLETMKAPVIFAAEEARGLLGLFATAIQGGSIYRKSSFLLDHLGKAVFPPFVHINERPHLAEAYGSAPFDEDGVATRPNVFVENGILQCYALGVYAARKLSMKTTGNGGGMHNLTIQPGSQNFDDLLRTMGKGLLITELMGQGVNLVTGNYSRGAAGFWVENGEIQFPVHEITVAGNLHDVFKHLVAVGNDVDTRGNIHTGSLLIEEMMIAGPS